MDAQHLIAANYKNAYCLSSVQELKRHKSQETIYIMGHGPSAFVIPQELDCKEINHDLSGTSASVFQSKYTDFYWYEPHFLENGEGFKLTTPESCSSYALSRIMHHEWTKEVSDENVGVVIPNPQFPANELGYADVTIHKNTLVPPWFFVNEISDEEISKGLRTWCRAPNREDLVLNFRGSVIRQLSTAFALGYKNIYIGGLDPSISGYWYTNRELREMHMKRDILKRNDRICKSYGTSLLRVAHTAPSGSALAGPVSTYYDFHRSIVFILFILCRLYPWTQTYLLANDPIIAKACIELGAVIPRNLYLLRKEDISI